MSYSFGVCGICACISMILIHLSGAYNLVILVEISKVSFKMWLYFQNSRKWFQWFSFCGKFAIQCSFAAQYVFISELYSTDVRSIGISFGSMISRIGGFIAPFFGMLPVLVYNFIFAFCRVPN